MTNEDADKQESKSKREKPVSLAPLTVEEVIKGLLETPPPPEGWTKKKPKKAKKPSK